MSDQPLTSRWYLRIASQSATSPSLVSEWWTTMYCGFTRDLQMKKAPEGAVMKFLARAVLQSQPCLHCIEELLPRDGGLPLQDAESVLHLEPVHEIHLSELKEDPPPEEDLRLRWVVRHNDDFPLAVCRRDVRVEPLQVPLGRVERFRGDRDLSVRELVPWHGVFSSYVSDVVRANASTVIDPGS
ncbi:MAG: hypothetical protein UU35_C0019G0013 [Candidatus Uhrbacteria bacterium GW2011_GWC2_41_11]|uniref:Uncharacterized protein n=1 Tax=Candidatus Uhrbacteria bacterium GW2011_GWC2_41_11 TaxID=1618985 RepID=A0A0G0UAZ2_9BACT|nr:MAG: hypothetical protein UU35_C0019G0013 [Candidatus Uhrbacteria bacterium GW2011_GWC2_41_11]